MTTTYDALSRYAAGSNLSKAGPIHELAVELRDGLLGNEAIQNLIMNKGYRLEDDQRPTSYHDVSGGTFNRKKISLQLIYGNLAMDVATRQERIALMREEGVEYSEGGVILPESVSLLEEPEISLVTPEGFDIDYVENLQEGWVLNPKTAQVIREYVGELSKSFDDFNLQLILTKMQQRGEDPISSNEGEIGEFQSRITDLMAKENIDPAVFSALDRGYYREATIHERRAASLWKDLNEDPYGMNFIMQYDDVQRFLVESMQD